MDEKPFSASFVPLLENTPPIDTRFVYDNFRDFKKYSILHHEGCISYIKDSDTFIQVMKNGYCKVLTYRIGIMDTSDFIKSISYEVPQSLDADTKDFVNYFLNKQNENKLPSIAFEKTEFDRWDSGKEKRDFTSYNENMHGYDILLDFTNNIFLYKVAKNNLIKNGEKDNYIIENIIIKIGILDNGVENIANKIYTISNNAVSSISDCSTILDLRNSLMQIFGGLRNTIKQQPASTDKKKYKQFKDETIINKNNSESSSSGSDDRIVVNHEDHL